MAEQSNGGAVRVLELAQEVTGPFVGRIFALSGADVVKVESLPDGDPMRAQDPAGSGASAVYEYLNAGKRSVGID
ncbi:MAG: CoA transferase, partial [Nitriliruptoraceae bacterium]